MTLGEKITKQRKELNYTQEQLADILEVSRQTISKWESDIAYPETNKLIELSKIFNCSIDYLIKEDLTTTNNNQTSCLAENNKGFYRNIINNKNKTKIKKILKIVGIIFAIIFVVDIISMLLYFFILGIPS